MREMSHERFRALADAYGGAVARWPIEVRAEALLLAGDPAMRAILAEAEALDATLDRWTVPAPDGALRTRIVAMRGHVARPWRRVKLWWSGIGVAAALAGAAAGSMAAATVLPSDPPTENVTAFGALGGQEG